MKYHIKRRKFLSFFTRMTPFLLLCTSLGNKVFLFFTGTHGAVKKDKTLSFTISELILKKQDTIERNPYYLKNWNGSSEYIQEMWLIEKLINQSKQDCPKGNIVILGAYKRILDIMVKKYGSENVIGVDEIKYTDHPNLIVSDIKLLKAGDLGSISLGWNNISLWREAPRLKLAGFNFLKKSLVPKGILVELPFRELPRDLNTQGLTLIKSSQHATTWRKV